MRILFSGLALVLLISIFSDNCSSYARDRAIQKLSLKDTQHGEKILNLSRKVGAVIYKLEDVGSSGLPFFEVPEGTRLITIHIQIINKSSRTIRIPQKSFKIITDDGKRVPNSGKRLFVLKGGEQTSFRLWFGLHKESLILQPRLVCDGTNISFPLPVEALIKHYDE